MLLGRCDGSCSPAFHAAYLRAIRSRLSRHSAFDLNLSYSDYWLWNAKSKNVPNKNRMPRQIVEIFERHGFIWGSKWYHYDTMHFEYRPELVNQ